MTLRVAIYARVSTLHQAQAQTIEQQLDRLRTYADEQGWHVQEEHIFRDDGRSGAELNRPGLDHLRDAVRNDELDRVLVTAPDRLARNYVQQMIVLDELERYGCQVEFLDRPMSDDPHDRLLLQIRGAVAEYERTLIADRMRRGRQMKYRAGVLLPWSRAPYGYRLNPDGHATRPGSTSMTPQPQWCARSLPGMRRSSRACVVWRSTSKRRVFPRQRQTHLEPVYPARHPPATSLHRASLCRTLSVAAPARPALGDASHRTAA